MSSARTTISMPEKMYTEAVARQQELGYANFSDYVQALLRADALQKGSSHVRETVLPYPQPNTPTAETPKEDRPVSYRKSSTKGTQRKLVDILKKHTHHGTPPTK